MLGSKSLSLSQVGVPYLVANPFDHALICMLSVWLCIGLSCTAFELRLKEMNALVSTIKHAQGSIQIFRMHSLEMIIHISIIFLFLFSGVCKFIELTYNP